MEQINPTMDRVDVCLVIGANDCEPRRARGQSSPIYGMPIIDADHCKTCIVMKRSMAAGFAGIENALFYKDNTRMLFGDAKGPRSTRSSPRSRRVEFVPLALPAPGGLSFCSVKQPLLNVEEKIDRFVWPSDADARCAFDRDRANKANSQCMAQSVSAECACRGCGIASKLTKKPIQWLWRMITRPMS